MTRKNLKYHYASLISQYLTSHKVYRHTKLFKSVACWIIANDADANAFLDAYENDPEIDDVTVHENGSIGAVNMINRLGAIDPLMQDGDSLLGLARSVVYVRVVNTAELIMRLNPDLREWNYDLENRVNWHNALNDFLLENDVDVPDKRDLAVAIYSKYEQEFANNNVKSIRFDEVFECRKSRDKRHCIPRAYKEAVATAITDAVNNGQKNFEKRQSAMLGGPHTIYGWIENGRLQLTESRTRKGLPRKAHKLIDTDMIKQNLLNSHPIVNAIDYKSVDKRAVQKLIDENTREYVELNN